eukprot:528450-Rhodomonas_salina.1
MGLIPTPTRPFSGTRVHCDQTTVLHCASPRSTADVQSVPRANFSITSGNQYRVVPLVMLKLACHCHSVRTFPKVSFSRAFSSVA